MGITTHLSLTLARHEDGCTIMSWHYESAFLTIGDQYEKLREGTFTEALEGVARWMDCVESGPTTSQELYEALQPYTD